MKGGGEGFPGGWAAGSGWGRPLLCRAKSSGRESPEQAHIRDLRSPLQEPLCPPREDGLGDKEGSLGNPVPT